MQDEFDDTIKIGPHQLQRRKDGELVMRQKQVNDFMESAGADPEAREKVQKAEEQLIDGALQAATEEVTNQPFLDKATVTLGIGDQRKRVSVEGRKKLTGRNPKTGEPVNREEFGYATIHRSRSFPKSLRDDRLEQIRRDCEAAFADK